MMPPHPVYFSVSKGVMFELIAIIYCQFLLLLFLNICLNYRVENLVYCLFSQVSFERRFT
jgi:hypothetical protein